MSLLVVDTGVLLAAADNDDADHHVCAQLLRGHRGELMVPAPVLPETCWQIERNLGAAPEAAFVRLVTTAELAVIDLAMADDRRCVTSIIVHGGKHTMVDVTLADGSKLTATDHHPFWDVTTGPFMYAIDLHAGDRVREADGTPLAIAAVHAYDQRRRHDSEIPRSLAI